MNAAVAWSALGVILVAVYITWTAGRLDRLHARVDGAWAALDAQLVRRSAAARALGVPPVTAAADAALEAGSDRQDRENDLSRALRSAWPEVPPGPARDELAAAASRVALARSFHNGAVLNAQALRRRRLVRLLHLAGHREMPRFFDVDETDFSDEAPASGA